MRTEGRCGCSTPSRDCRQRVFHRLCARDGLCGCPTPSRDCRPRVFHRLCARDGLCGCPHSPSHDCQQRVSHRICTRRVSAVVHTLSELPRLVITTFCLLHLLNYKETLIVHELCLLPRDCLDPVCTQSFVWLSDGTIDVSHITPSFRHVEEGWVSSCTKCQLQSLRRPNMRPNLCGVQLHRGVCCMFYFHPPTSRRNNRMALTEAYTRRCIYVRFLTVAYRCGSTPPRAPSYHPEMHGLYLMETALET